MAWILRKSFTFEASHLLPYHDGKCARLHGHSWRLSVEIRGDILHIDGPKQAMVFDYNDMSTVVKPFVDAYLDHWHLNDSTGLESPTSEALAQWIYTQLAPHLPLHAVTIEETCTSWCRYEP